MQNNEVINVTKPSLPELEDLLPYLKKIWANKILTNGGPFHKELEDALCEFLGVKYISLFANGTLALITALQSLEISGEVLTTPYTFVATAHSILWTKNKPVFVDIDPNSLNIDPNKIEPLITKETKAIMPVHCYGNPCATLQIEKIAQKYDLKVIYDACHAFGVKDTRGSILNYGDLSVLSFHATKVFNTFEGGAIVSHSKEMKLKIDQLKNFGFVDEITVINSGINSKMSEINSAIGLLQLKNINKIIENRRFIDETYRKLLDGVNGIRILNSSAQTQNFSYFPILIEDNFPIKRDELYLKLKNANIFARRYFYPLVTDFPMYRNFAVTSASDLTNAYKASNKILCLPIYEGLTKQEISYITDVIKS